MGSDTVVIVGIKFEYPTQMHLATNSKASNGSAFAVMAIPAPVIEASDHHFDISISVKVIS
jgi:hypothetical protein